MTSGIHVSIRPARWSLADAIDLCRRIEAVCPAFGCHVALTGGCLYRDGARKDLDILLYRIRQADAIDVDGLFDALAEIGLGRLDDGPVRWCVKARFAGRPVDIFFPEQPGDYPSATEDVPC